MICLSEATAAGVTIKELFTAFDTDENGEISRDEFRKVMELVGFVPNETVITLKMDTPVTVYVAVSSLRHGGLTESMPAQGWETMGGQSLGWAG